MLPKSKRLTTEDFKVLRGGRVLHTLHLLVRLFPAAKGTNLSVHGCKAAVIVAGSSYKKAVDRNLLRRRLYSIIERNADLLPHASLTIICKKGALEASFSELQREFQAILPKKA